MTVKLNPRANNRYITKDGELTREGLKLFLSFVDRLNAIEAGTVTLEKLVCDNIQIDLNTISATNTNGSIVIKPNGGGQLQFRSNSPVFEIRDMDSTGASVAAYLSFQDSADSEIGWVGFGSGSNTDLSIDNNLGDVVINPNSGNDLKIILSTEDLAISDAGSAGATEQDWIEVEVDGNIGYIRVHATK